jgi:hypothetical protein
MSALAASSLRVVELIRACPFGRVSLCGDYTYPDAACGKLSEPQAREELQ